MLLFLSLCPPSIRALGSDPANATHSSPDVKEVEVGKNAAESSFRFEPTKVDKILPPGVAPSGMVLISGGDFSMGSEDARGIMCGGPDAMADARPIHRVHVDGFWMDKTEVTNEQFAKFVKATGYVTIAEQTPKPDEFPNLPSRCPLARRAR